MTRSAILNLRWKLAAIILLAAAPAAAQQFFTDDAGVVHKRACQLEAWYGQRASWILPACRPHGPVELTLGVGVLREENVDGSDYVADVAAQAKVLLRELDGWGVAWATGAGVRPRVFPGQRRFANFHSYLAFTESLAGDRVHLHQNIGMQAHRAEGSVEADGLWGGRADLALHPRVWLLGELFGAFREPRPEYQGGVRLVLRPERLSLDIAYGGHSARALRGAGFTVGIAWTPRPIF